MTRSGAAGERELRSAPADTPCQIVPFPVPPRYGIRPDLVRLADDPFAPAARRHFVLDDRWPRYLGEKRRLLEGSPALCRAVAPGSDPELLERSLWQVAALAAAELPGHLRLDGGTLEVPRLGLRVERGVGPLPLADAIAQALQEDLVLVAGPPEADRVELMHVCFPSHWNPAERTGRSFAAIHRPIPHSGRLVAAARNLVAAMLRKGPFVRYVWSLTRDAELDQNPARRTRAAESGEGEGGRDGGDPLDFLHFRAERQTTRALGDHALFTIRIYVAPLRSVLDPERAASLAAAVRSMDAELLRYKGLLSLRGELLVALERYARGS